MARSLSGQNRQDDWTAVSDLSLRRSHPGIGDWPEVCLRTFIVAVEGRFSKSTAKIPSIQERSLSSCWPAAPSAGSCVEPEKQAAGMPRYP
jgi:hypothetical protein